MSSPAVAALRLADELEDYAATHDTPLHLSRGAHLTASHLKSGAIAAEDADDYMDAFLNQFNRGRRMVRLADKWRERPWKRDP